MQILSNFLFCLKYFRKWATVKIDPNGTEIPPNVHDARNKDQREDGESTDKLHKKLHFWRTGVPDRQKVIDKSASFKFYYPIIIYISNFQHIPDVVFPLIWKLLCVQLWQDLNETDRVAWTWLWPESCPQLREAIL